MNHIENNRCCICDGKIISEEDLTICENCNNIYHKICWQQVGEQCIYCKNKQKSEITNNKNRKVY